MKIATRMFTMVLVCLTGMALLLWLSLSTIERVKVGGPIYTTIMQQKDLAADILPPPEYILESYLTLQLANDARSRQEQEKLLGDFKRLRKDFEERHEFWKKELAEGETKKVLLEDAYRPAVRFYDEALAKYFPALLRGEREKADAILTTSLRESYGAHRREVDRLVQLADTACRNGEKMAAGSLKSSILAIYAVGCALLILSALLSLFIARSITRPLGTCVAIANRLATGDLTEEIPVHSRDETGMLMAAMKNMVENLRNLVTSTVTISATISSAASQLHATSDHIAAGAQKVEAQTVSLATASEQMAGTSCDIARSCTLAANRSSTSSSTAANGAAIVQESIKGIVCIAERVHGTAQAVSTLGSRSEQIGAIIATIEDIADQTNLLALNAAIEAARAGEQGRGFAVVADEVRALAERTTFATKEISEMIKTMQRETREAVHSMEEGVEEVVKGAASSKESGDALQEILDGIGEVSMQINQIATAAEQQTITTGQISENLRNVSEVVKDTARDAVETTAASAELAEQARQLQRLVSVFKVA